MLWGEGAAGALPVTPTSSLRPSTPSSCSPAPAGVWCPGVAEPQVHLPDRTRTLPGRGDPQAESSLQDALILAHPPRLCPGLPGRWSIWKGSFRWPVSLERVIPTLLRQTPGLGRNPSKCDFQWQTSLDQLRPAESSLDQPGPPEVSLD